MIVATIKIGERFIGPGHPTFIVAEMSGNHNQSFQRALELIHAAKDAGADAVKLQTYTPDTLTIDCDNEYFRIKAGNTWGGKTLYELYKKTYTPWEWQPRLKEEADKIGLPLFSTPFDRTAVDFLKRMDIPAFKIASFELVDILLVKYIAQDGKPIIMSTGMATLAEIEEAVRTVRENGDSPLILMKCVSDYPADPADMNLRTIPNMSETFGVAVGVSDHTLGNKVAIAAVALGACVIEKHLTLSRAEGGPDASFSLEPDEFGELVEAVRLTEKALGEIFYGPADSELKSRIFRRSLCVVEDIESGEQFTHENVRSIRPGYGLHTRYLDEIIGRCAGQDIKRGTPLSWSHIAGS